MSLRGLGRRSRASAQPAKLNLVSLMDIFTILVFFLLLNSADVEVLQAGKTIRLPDSHAEQRPRPTVVIAVDAQWISFNGKQLVTVSDVLASADPDIPGLSQALAEQARKFAVADADTAGIRTDNRTDNPAENSTGMAITVLGDRQTPYALLKKIIHTCAASDFQQVSLAVNRLPSTRSTL